MRYAKSFLRCKMVLYVVKVQPHYFMVLVKIKHKDKHYFNHKHYFRFI